MKMKFPRSHSSHRVRKTRERSKCVRDSGLELVSGHGRHAHTEGVLNFRFHNKISETVWMVCNRRRGKRNAFELILKVLRMTNELKNLIVPQIT